MNAFITFCRQNAKQSIEKEIHLLGIKNPKNISVLEKFNLRSGQPIVCVIESFRIIAFYLITNDGELHQIYGSLDFLFEIEEIDDFCLINLKKYNYINYTLLELFKCISREESKIYSDLFESFEETIFYNLLHTESDFLKIKNFIKKEINKLDISILLKTRMFKTLSVVKSPNNKILKKKIDVDLHGYTIKINTMLT
jgi:hypothetical protein